MTRLTPCNLTNVSFSPAKAQNPLTGPHVILMKRTVGLGLRHSNHLTCRHRNMLTCAHKPNILSIPFHQSHWTPDGTPQNKSAPSSPPSLHSSIIHFHSRTALWRISAAFRGLATPQQWGRLPRGDGRCAIVTARGPADRRTGGVARRGTQLGRGMSSSPRRPSLPISRPPAGVTAGRRKRTGRRRGVIRVGASGPVTRPRAAESSESEPEPGPVTRPWAAESSESELGSPDQ